MGGWGLIRSLSSLKACGATVWAPRPERFSATEMPKWQYLLLVNQGDLFLHLQPVFGDTVFSGHFLTILRIIFESSWSLFRLCRSRVFGPWHIHVLGWRNTALFLVTILAHEDSAVRQDTVIAS